MKVSDFFILAILFTLLGASVYLLWLYFPSESVNYQAYKAQIGQEFPRQSNQFYPNMRYSDKRITYALSDACTLKKKNDFRDAVRIIQESTVLEFREVSTSADIEVTCSNIAPEPDQEGHFVAGEGGPALFLNTTKYAIILEGEIALYRPETCDSPNIALHELLHALGFDHNSNEESIMFPVTSCDQAIDEEIISEINRVYAEPSLPDLVIEKIEAEKAGRYLNFEITVANLGLKDVGNSALEVSAEGELIKSFELGDVELGAKRQLTVTNLRVPFRAEEINFVVKTAEAELSKENNDAIIYPG